MSVPNQPPLKLKSVLDVISMKLKTYSFVRHSIDMSYKRYKNHAAAFALVLLVWGDEMGLRFVRRQGCTKIGQIKGEWFNATDFNLKGLFS